MSSPVSDINANANFSDNQISPKEEEPDQRFDTTVAQVANSAILKKEQQTDLISLLQSYNVGEAKRAFASVPESLKPGYLQSVDPDGRTALHWVLINGDDNLFHEVLKYFPRDSFFVQDKRDETPLHWAVRYQDETIAVKRLKELLKPLSMEQKIRLCQIKDEKEQTVFHWAAQRLHVMRALMEELEDADLFLFFRDKNILGLSPLHIAATLLDEIQAIDVTNAILSNLSFDARAKLLKVPNNEGFSALHLAARLENSQLAEQLTMNMLNLLLPEDRFESLVFLDKDGRTTFHWAASQEKLLFLILQTLTPDQRIVALNFQDSDQLTPIDWLRVFQQERVFRVLSLLPQENKPNSSTNSDVDKIDNFLEIFLKLTPTRRRDFQELLARRAQLRRARNRGVTKRIRRYPGFF